MGKEDILWTIGMILCSPFIALYYIVKWAWQLTPWQIWKWIKRNREVHRLEETLNFEEAAGETLSFFDGSCSVLLLVHKDSYDMADYVKTGVQPLLFRGKPWTAKAYFDFIQGIWRSSWDLTGQLSTLQECGNYEDYYVAFVPGEHQVSEVEAGTDEQLNEFIADFKRKYKKENG